ncbi:MAG TPA: hypothetical protein VJ963_07510 [Bacteroidales bacterium]|nr:hypothetical protein [Bacteroidales bacterium]
MKKLLLISKAAIFLMFFCLFSNSVKGQDNMGNTLPQFIFPTFRPGVILFKDGQQVKMLLNYNMVDQMMVTEVEGIYRYSKNPDLIDTIYIGDRKFVPLGRIFYELLAGGPVPFYLQNKSSYTPKGADIGYGAKSQSVGPTQYKRFEVTNAMSLYNEVVKIDLPPNVTITKASDYWVNKDGQMEDFNNSRQFLKIFPDKEAALKQFIKKQRINFTRREDVIKLGQYCNSLYR